MAIVRWEPLRDLMTAQTDFGRLFREAFAPFSGETEISTRAWAPPVDIYETENDIVVKAELPGVDPKDLNVHVEDNTLYLKGERNYEKDVKEQNYHRIERSYGSFARSFSLPSSIDASTVKAEFKDGLLTVTMPKREEAKPKTVKVEVAANQPAASQPVQS